MWILVFSPRYLVSSLILLSMWKSYQRGWWRPTSSAVTDMRLSCTLNARMVNSCTFTKLRMINGLTLWRRGWIGNRCHTAGRFDEQGAADTAQSPAPGCLGAARGESVPFQFRQGDFEQRVEIGAVIGARERSGRDGIGGIGRAGSGFGGAARCGRCRSARPLRRPGAPPRRPCLAGRRRDTR